jgi:hypothetical protein
MTGLFEAPGYVVVTLIEIRDIDNPPNPEELFAKGREI